MIYVLQVMTGKEVEVLKALKDIDIKAFVPLGFRYKRIKGAWEEDSKVIFTGYVFVEMTYTADNYYKVSNISNVIKFLKNDDTPLILSHLESEWIKILNDFANKPTFIKLDDKTDSYKIVSGVLSSFETKITKIDKHKRFAQLEIKLFDEVYKIQLGIDIV
ncbi:MAG: hypothetical protein KGV43_02395 [Arcobacter sp.]|nr:hypothetical protein [Arcobacter sp.]